MKKEKQKYFLALVLNLGFMTANAQQAITGSGGDASGSGGTAAYSVGQIIYTNTNIEVREGVQQTYEIYPLSIEDQKNSFAIQIYSNPTSEELKFKVDPLEDGMHVQLTDMQGRVLESKRISNNETSLQMASLAVGTYFLKITDSVGKLKTYKIIKN